MLEELLKGKAELCGHLEENHYKREKEGLKGTGLADTRVEC